MLCHMAVLFLVYPETSILFPTVTASVYIPTRGVCGQSLYLLSNFIVKLKT